MLKAWVAAALIGTGTGHAEEAKAPQRAINYKAFSGNVVLGESALGTPVPGGGVRVLVLQNPACGFGCEGRGDALWRIGLEGVVGGQQTDDGEASVVQGYQARVGAGVFEKDRLYYMVSANSDHDSARVGEHIERIFAGVYGGELGKALDFGRTTVYAGVYSGVGVVRGASGVLPIQREQETVRSGLGVGVNIDLRRGAPDTKGTVHATYTASVLPGGRRSNVAADLNISDHIQVGAGYRQSSIRTRDGGGFGIGYPFVRVSLTGAGQGSE